jgi:predicted dehydrogenase
MTSNSSPPRFRFGVIGCGRVVQELHLPAWSLVPEAELVAICDSASSALRAVARQAPAARQYAKLQDFLEEGSDLSFVVMATPGASHAAIGEQVLRRRLNLLVEKPLALDAAAARRLYELADTMGVELTCVHNYRFRENTQRAIDLFQKGALGHIVAVNARFRSGPLFGELAAWRRKERESRTLLFDFGIHLVDIALLCLGQVDSVRFVDADLDSAGLQRVVFGTTHHNGARGSFDFMLDAASASAEIEVLGESRALALQFYPDGLRELPRLDTPLHRCLSEGRRLYDYAGAVVAERLFRRVSHRTLSHARLFQAFIGSLKGLAPNPVPHEEVLRTIELIDLIAERVYAGPRLSRPGAVAAENAMPR